MAPANGIHSLTCMTDFLIPDFHMYTSKLLRPLLAAISSEHGGHGAISDDAPCETPVHESPAPSRGSGEHAPLSWVTQAQAGQPSDADAVEAWRLPPGRLPKTPKVFQRDLQTPRLEEQLHRHGMRWQPGEAEGKRHCMAYC